MTAPRTRVANVRRPPPGSGVYIGRAGHGEDGYFGNPFAMPSGTGRRDPAVEADALGRYRAYLLDRAERDPEFRRRARMLRGETLLCFCSPAACHGDVLAAWADAQPLAENRDDWPAAAREEYEERAGIMEHDGGMPREEAERGAEAIVRGRWGA